MCIFILVVEMCERLTYYSFAGSQRYFLMGPLGYDQAQATSLNSAFSILCYFTPILGGWMADAKFGRFKTIVILTAVYVCGVFVAAIAAYPAISNDILYFLGTMGLVALGSGGIKPNVSNMGGDQFDINDPQELKDQETFFSYFYMMINVGAGVAYGYLTTLAQNGHPPAIPKAYGFFFVYMLASGCMLTAYIIFLVASPRYVKKPPSGDSLRGLVYYISKAGNAGFKGKIAMMGWVTLLVFLSLVVAVAFVSGDIRKVLSYVNFGLGFTACSLIVTAHMNNDYMEAIEDHPSGILTCQEGRDALETVPTLLVVNVCFSIVYNQMNGPFQSQACQMDLYIGGTQLNAAFFNIADCIAIIIFVPLLENIAFPLIARAKGSPVTLNQKLLAGLAVAGLAMVVATGLEYLRRAMPIVKPHGEIPNTKCCHHDPAAADYLDVCVGNQKSEQYPNGPVMTADECIAAGIINSTTEYLVPNIYYGYSACFKLSKAIPMHDISAFIMFIPFFIVGLGECLVNPVLMYFVYDQAPPRTRSLVQAFNMLCMGSISNGFTAAVTLALSPFYPDNLDDGQIEYFYFVGFGFAILGMPLSLFVMSQFTPKNYTDDAGDVAISSGDLLAEDGEKARRRSSLMSSRMSTRE